MGRGKHAEWLGSTAWDGYPEGLPQALKDALTEGAFRAEVSRHLASRDDATLPEDGWPWPWSDSRTTDYAYAFDDGQVWGCYFGYRWFPASEEDPELPDDCPKEADFPDMSARRSVAPAGDRRSGVMVFHMPRGA